MQIVELEILCVHSGSSYSSKPSGLVGLIRIAGCEAGVLSGGVIENMESGLVGLIRIVGCSRGVLSGGVVENMEPAGLLCVTPCEGGVLGLLCIAGCGGGGGGGVLGLRVNHHGAGAFPQEDV